MEPLHNEQALLFILLIVCQATIRRPLKNKEVEGRGVLGIKGASERGGGKE